MALGGGDLVRGSCSVWMWMPLPMAYGLLGATACTAAEGHPPVARIEVSPPGVLEDDGFQTVLTLDARASSDAIDDPEGLTRLAYTWHISGDEVRLDEGTLSSPSLSVRLRGNRPATVTLTVADEDGLENTASLQILLTVR